MNILEVKTLSVGSGRTESPVTFDSTPSEGELIVLVFAHNNAGLWSAETPPEGFTLLGHAQGGSEQSSQRPLYAMYGKIAGDSEPSPATYAITHNSQATAMVGYRLSAGLASLDDIDAYEITTDFVDVSSVNIPAAPLSIPAGSVAILAASGNGQLGTYSGDSLDTDLTASASNTFMTASSLEFESEDSSFQVTLSFDPDVRAAAVLIVVPPAAVAGPNVKGTTKLQAGKPLTITGTNFGATEGAVVLSPSDDIEDEDAEVQAITSWGDTEIVTDGLTLPTGAGPGDTVYLFVENDSEEINAAGFAVQVADPALVIADTILDTDDGDPINLESVEVVVLGGSAGARTVTLNPTDAEIDAGALAIRDAAFSIDEIEDTYLIGIIESGERMSLHGAVVVDGND